ncbi:MAG: hypothetical protein Fur007_17510 [Rhodoferax sp.]
MQDSQILSVLTEPPELPPTKPPEPLVVHDTVNACEVGVVLRAVAAVELGVAVLAAFGSLGPVQWLGRFAVLTAAALPAVLVWLLLLCACRRVMRGIPPWARLLLVGVAGAGAGAYGAMLWVWVDPAPQPAPWLASAALGAWLACGVWVALVWRLQARAPAAARARLAELQARIRPHFLFNTLNSAIALVRAEPEQAERLLEDLSDLFRAALQEPAASVTLADELALAQRYLAIEQLRFGPRLRVRWSLDAQAEAARLPPLTLQPLVENAVTHGVEPAPQGGEVRISTQRRGAIVVIKITNSLPPGEQAASAGHGLALDNVRQRLALLHDVQAEFRAGRARGVFQVRIQMPL